MPKCIIKTVFIAKRKQNEKKGMNYLKRDEKKKKKQKQKQKQNKTKKRVM